jgi:hypothetical protein
MRQLIGNTILFLLAVMERERKLYPEIEMDAFYDSDNYEKNLWISVFNACVEVTEPSVFFNPDDYSFIKEFIDRREEITSEYKNYSRYYYPVSYKVFDPSIIETNENTGDYDYQVVKYYKNIEKTRYWYPVLSRLLDKFPEIETGFFSKITGPLKIKTHRGPYRGLIRGHITIETSDTNDSKLVVLNATDLKWKTGGAFVFDDTYYHRLDKTDNGTRVSFIFDIKRKFKSSNMNTMNDIIIRGLRESDYVQECYEKL